MPNDIEDREPVQAIDHNLQTDRYIGNCIDAAPGATAGQVSINTGDLGPGNAAIEVAGGSNSIIVSGTKRDLATQTVDVRGGDPNPRIDVVVADSSSVYVIEGQPEAAQYLPGVSGGDAGVTLFDAARPAPNDTANDPVTVLGAIAVPEAAATITATNIEDRRVFLKRPHSAASVADIDDLRLQSNPAAVSAGGLVVPVSEATGVGDAIDPSTTPTPLQDAADLVSANGGGAVLLPPQTIDEEQSFELRAGVSIQGWGTSVSAVRFVNGNQFKVSAGSGTSHDGFSILGPGLSTSSTIGMVFFDPVQNIRFGDIRIADFANEAMRSAIGTDNLNVAFNTLTIENCDPGNNSLAAVTIRSNSEFSFRRLDIDISDAFSGVDADALFVDSSKSFRVGELAVGGSCARALKSVGANRITSLGTVRYAPTAPNSTVNAAISLQSATPTNIGPLLIGSGSNAANGVALDGSGRNYVGPVSDPAGTTTNQVVVNQDTTAATVYEGASGNVSNNTGAALSFAVSCLYGFTTVT